MRDIVGNHVALVKEGRAGSDVVVGDSMENVMAKKVLVALTAHAAMLCGATAATLMPKLAMDAKVDIAPLFKDVTSKNFKQKKPGIVAGIKTLTKDNLAQDADLEDVVALLDKLEGAPAVAGKDDTEANGGLPMNLPDDDTSLDADPVDGAAPPSPAAKVKEMLEAAGVDPAVIQAVCQAIGGSDAFPEDLKKDGKKDDEKKDDKDDKKPAMDEKTVKGIVEAAVTANDNAHKALRQAEVDVVPYIGKTGLAMDTAEEVYRHTLTGLGVKHEGVTAEGLRPLLLALTPQSAKRPIALDEKKPGGFAERFPTASNISTM